MSRPLKRFPEEFKLEAVKLLECSNKSIEIIAKELNVGVSTLHAWRSKYSSSPVRKNAANKTTITDKDIELLRMKRENERLKKENEILKKAAVSSNGQCNIILLPVYKGTRNNEARRKIWIFT